MDKDLRKAYLKSLSAQNTSSGKNSRPANLWVFASGKGGVGKTFVSSSFAITLSKLGHKVVLIDLDLSGANMHTALGLPPSNEGVRQFFEGTKTLDEVALPTPFIRLRYVQGIIDSWVPTDFSLPQIKKLVSAIGAINADYVIVDVGAGATETHLELFMSAQEKFLVTSPEPTSIEKNYRFIESFFCHSIRETSTPEAYEKMIENLQNHRKNTFQKPFSFRSYLKSDTGISYDFFANLANSPLRLIINSSRSKANYDLGHSIKSVCNKYYDLNIDYVGAVDFDNAVWQSVSCRQHLFASQPFTPLAGQFLAICKHLIDPEELRAVV